MPHFSSEVSRLRVTYFVLVLNISFIQSDKFIFARTRLDTKVKTVIKRGNIEIYLVITLVVLSDLESSKNHSYNHHNKGLPFFGFLLNPRSLLSVFGVPTCLYDPHSRKVKKFHKMQRDLDNHGKFSLKTMA